MADFNVTIEKFIFHFTGFQDLLTVKREYPVNSKPEISDFFCEHIRNVLRDPVKKAARFTDPGANMSVWTNQILNGEPSFVEDSQAIAGRLFDSMKSDSRIAKGNLAVILFRDTTQLNPQPQLALLKFDPSPTVITSLDDTTDDVDFTAVENSLPSTRETLQKAAIVQPIDAAYRRYYDLLMVDRQSTGDTVATFFKTAFLDVTETYTTAERTRKLYESIIMAGRNLFQNGRINPGQQNGFELLANDAFSQVKIEVVSWLQNHPLTYITDDANLKEEIRKEILNVAEEKRLTDMEFEIDQEKATALAARIVYLGPPGFKIEFTEEMVQEKLVELNAEYNGQRGIFIAVPVEDLRRVVKR